MHVHTMSNTNVKTVLSAVDYVLSGCDGLSLRCCLYNEFFFNWNLFVYAKIRCVGHDYRPGDTSLTA